MFGTKTELEPATAPPAAPSEWRLPITMLHPYTTPEGEPLRASRTYTIAALRAIWLSRNGFGQLPLASAFQLPMQNESSLPAAPEPGDRYIW